MLVWRRGHGMKCPNCSSENTVKNGTIHNGKAKRMCKDCRRQLVPDATKKVIAPQTWELIDKLLLEKIPLAGIARVTGISEDYLQEYVNKKYAAVPREARVRAKKKAG
jgi:transposase-like protein